MLDAYHALGSEVVVAVRSSATGEDGRDASFAGMNATITNVSGDDGLIDAVLRCWMSLFSPRVITYRASRNFTAAPAMAVVVQEMVDSEKAGVAFTADPSNGALDRVVIEGAFGLGEVVVSGEVEPDTYIVSKETLEPLDVRVGHKAFKIVRGEDGQDTIVNLDDGCADSRVLSDDELRSIAELAVATERHNGCPQDAEWAISNGTTYLVQARPITTLRHTAAPSSEKHAVLARGLAAAPGMASGKVRVLETPDEGDRLLEGEILVAQMTNPDWLPTIRRAAALVTDTGGMTCHAAIVARELGVPCIVGTRTATRGLHDGTTATVDGDHGQVVTGRVEATPAVSVADRRAPAEPQAEVTGTKVYVNLAMPDTAEAVAAQGPDGVGLLRAEFMLTEAFGGRHPRDLIAHGEQNALVAGLVTPLLRIASAFAPRPVVYRATDFRTNEFRGLKGGDAYEPVEHNPMIGYRGWYRYVKEPDLFALELQALAQAREQSPNVHLMIPFVRTRRELEECLSLVDASPLGRHRGPSLGDGGGPVGHALVARVHRYGHRRRVDRQQRPHPVNVGGRPRFRCVRRVVRRIRSGGSRRHRPNHRYRTQIRDHVVAVWPGALDQPGLRRTPRADGHHVGVGEPGCAGRRPADDRRRRTPTVAGLGAVIRP